MFRWILFGFCFFVHIHVRCGSGTMYLPRAEVRSLGIKNKRTTTSQKKCVFIALYHQSALSMNLSFLKKKKTSTIKTQNTVCYMFQHCQHIHENYFYYLLFLLSLFIRFLFPILRLFLYLSIFLLTQTKQTLTYAI